MIMTVIIILVIHLILCIISLVLALFKIYRVSVSEYIYLLLIPIIGPLSMLVLEIHKSTSDGAEVTVLSKFKLESDIYRSLGFETGNEEVISLEEAMLINNSNTQRSLMMDLIKENVIPVEEALTIGSTEIRRKLMMDVLNSNTAAFYDLLEQARLNDDVEVVHYATTAMAEMSKHYDNLLGKFREKFEDEPENTELLEAFCENYERYISIGILSGRMLDVARNEYIELIKTLIAREPTERNYCSLVKQQMLSNDFSSAQESFNEIFDRWPGSEQAWLLYIEMFYRMGDGKNLNKKVNEALREHVYFSAQSRKKLEFWLGRKID